jgi:hypothetical protein
LRVHGYFRHADKGFKSEPETFGDRRSSLLRCRIAWSGQELVGALLMAWSAAILVGLGWRCHLFLDLDDRRTRFHVLPLRCGDRGARHQQHGGAREPTYPQQLNPTPRWSAAPWLPSVFVGRPSTLVGSALCALHPRSFWFRGSSTSDGAPNRHAARYLCP